MADSFDGVRIEDSAGNPVSLADLRKWFGDGLKGTWDRTVWVLRKIYLPEGAMTTWISFQDSNGNVMPDQPVSWSWPGEGSPVQSPSDGGGRSNWVIGNDIWIDGGRTSGQPNHYVGPYKADGIGFHFEGIGWAGGTTHMKPAFYLVRAGGQAPPPVVIPPPAPGGSGSVDRGAIVRAVGEINAALKRIDEQIVNIMVALK